MSIAISSGHSKYVAGAIGLVKEVEEARKITDRIANLVDDVMTVAKFHDNTSRTQRDNINTIVAWHNKQNRKADYSIHLNSSGGGTRNEDIGVEVLYYDEPNRKHAEQLAKNLAAAVGLKNRGAKKRTDLGFLANTKKPAFLIEAYFVNSRADVSKMDEAHEINAFAQAFAKTVCEYHGVKYEQTNSKPHRVKSGTFNSKQAAEVAKQKLANNNIASELYTQIVQDGASWRFVTGTYPSKHAAHNAIQKMKQLNILKTAHAVEA